MNEVVNGIKPTSPEAITRIGEFIKAVKAACPDESGKASMTHTFHAGVYARTLFIPKDMIAANEVIKIATILIVDGDCLITDTETTRRIRGHEVLLGAPMRQCIVRTLQDTTFTMIFATKAKTVEEAEAEFAVNPSNLLKIGEKRDERSIGYNGSRRSYECGKCNLLGQASEGCGGSIESAAAGGHGEG